MPAEEISCIKFVFAIGSCMGATVVCE